MRHVISGETDAIIKAIDNCIVGYKSKRNREILKDHYIDGETFEEIAEKYKMSVSQVKRISYNNEKVILKYLDKMNENEPIIEQG